MIINRKTLEVIRDSLEIVRKLAAEYEGLNNDTISINLMLVMLTDEVEEQIDRHWQDCSMFSMVLAQKLPWHR